MEGFIICAGTIGLVVVVLGFVLLMRYLSYRETLALAEKGLVRPGRERNGGRATLIWGVIIAAVGLALMLGLWPLGLTGFGTSYPLGFGPWMLAGLVPLFFGLALVLIYVLTRGEQKREDSSSAEIYPRQEDL